ncbi:MAG TPA: TIGR04086 family membrane protein [Firmicutes bacterium]|nr:TIGR04086 family membrane protein [Bacillota bacterium]
MNRSGNMVPLPSWNSAAVWGVAKGLLFSILISLGLLLVCSLVLHFSAVPEKVTPYLACGVALLSVLCGSYYAGKRIGFRGWLHGGVVGLLYIVILLLVGILAHSEFAFGLYLVSKLFLGFVFGAAGGMWGVNS